MKTITDAYIIWFSSLVGGVLFALGFPNILGEVGSPFFALLGLFIFFIPLPLWSYKKTVGKELITVVVAWYLFSLSASIITIMPLVDLIETYFKLSSFMAWSIFLLFVPTMFPYLLFFLVMVIMFNHFLSYQLPRRGKKIIYAMALSLCAYFSPQIFTVNIGYSYLPWAPFIGSISWTGVIGLAFFSYLLIFTVTERCMFKRWDFISLGMCIIFIALNFAFPLQYAPQGRGIQIKLVQPSFIIDTSLKGQHMQQQLAVLSKRLFDLSLKGKKSDLIIWPESIYPFTLEMKYMDKGAMPKLAGDVLFRTGARLLTGVNILGRQQQRWNSLVLFQLHHPWQLYIKQQLIPFFEKGWIGDHRNMFQTKSSLNVMKLDNINILPTICFDIIKTNYLKNRIEQLPQQVDLIVNVANDRWFNDSSLAKHHLYLARWKSVELGIPLVRVTNNGVSGVFYPDGSQSATLAFNETSILDIELKISK